MFNLFKQAPKLPEEIELEKRRNLITDHKKFYDQLLKNNKLPSDLNLTTERYHSKTTQLSELANNNLIQGIKILMEADGFVE